MILFDINLFACQRCPLPCHYSSEGNSRKDLWLTLEGAAFCEAFPVPAEKSIAQDIFPFVFEDSCHMPD